MKRSRFRPAATALEHMDDAGDRPAIINPARSRWFFGKRGSIAAYASSDDQNNERNVPNSLMLQRRPPESMRVPIFKRLIGFGT